MARLLSSSIQRYPGGPESQKATCAAILESFSATAPCNHASSAFVATASGGGGTRNSLPDEMTHVFQVPALGSMGWLRDCANAACAHARLTNTNKRLANTNMSSLLATTQAGTDCYSLCRAV